MLEENKALWPATATAGAIPIVEPQAVGERKTTRLYYLDWVKAGCIALLVPYHAALIFASYLPYHLKTKETSAAFTVFNMIVLFWYVSVLMLIAGFGANKALERRTVGQFVMERLKRLFLPLVFGVFVIVPPQIYIERLYYGQVNYSYLEFYRHLFDKGTYPNGSISWHHLWYIAYLFVISLALLPLCLRVKKWAATSGKSKLMAVLSTKYGSLLLMLPFLVLEFGLRIYFSFSYPDFVHDGLNLLMCCIFYMYGFMMAGNEQLFNAFLSARKICLVTAVTVIALYFGLVLSGAFDPNVQGPWVLRSLHMLRGITMWCCTVAIIGYAAKYLNVKNGLLKYASKAFLPVYIVHQTILFIVAYYVLPLPFSLFEKFMILTLLTYIFSIGFYELVIRRFKWIGLFFGV
jgi:hypothetical protein